MATMQQIAKRRPPTTSIYSDNYGYTINFYQPMLDYLDAKAQGTKPQLPHLPWSNERGLKKYWPCNSVPTYTSKDIEKYSDEVVAHAKNRERNFEDYKIIKRSPLAVTKSAIGARLSHRLGRSKYETVEERTIRSLEEQASERHLSKVMDDIENIKARFNAHKDVEISTGLKNAIRGKSASQISAALLAESEKNIKVSRNQEDFLITQAQQSTQSYGRAKVTKRCTHIEFVDDRLIDNLDRKVGSSLCDVKRQLQSFNQRTSDLYYDSRCCHKNKF
ncbi:paramyosin, short form-like [Sitodiplosis mosellana]|uniref:paramyosin, short form-like n=1 Tax=Sitodiplosis mosellana TaxID=263140 RepID=UPI002443ABAC|nr:paramyosin, short form-like [Sitodiplosis mosellana]